jgi:hypothetical protein
VVLRWIRNWVAVAGARDEPGAVRSCWRVSASAEVDGDCRSVGMAC